MKGDSSKSQHMHHNLFWLLWIFIQYLCIYFHIRGHFTLSLCHVWVKEIVSYKIFMDYNSN